SNRFTAVDSNAWIDTDGDGFPDALETLLGSDPGNPNSTPTIPGPTEALGPMLSLLENVLVAPTQLSMEALGSIFSMVNGFLPPPGPQPAEALGANFSMLNGLLPPPTAQ